MTPHRLERLFIYYPSRQVNGNPGVIGLAYQDVHLVTDDKVNVHGWFVPCEGARGTLLIFHGNAGNIGDRLPWIELLHNLGVHVFIIDYRGYGKSEGDPFEEGLYRDARAAYNWWAGNKRSEDEKLILFGESLGGAVAVHLAARVSPAGLILQSTFTSARDMAKTLFPIGLLFPLARVQFNAAEEIAQVACPKLIIHGTRDEIVPFRLGKSLYELAPPPKFFYAVPEAGTITICHGLRARSTAAGLKRFYPASSEIRDSRFEIDNPSSWTPSFNLEFRIRNFVMGVAEEVGFDCAIFRKLLIINIIHLISTKYRRSAQSL